MLGEIDGLNEGLNDWEILGLKLSLRLGDKLGDML